MNIGQVIEEGKQAYRDGLSKDDCPYEPPLEPTVTDGFHGAKCIGKVRSDIDLEQLWQTGWEIAQRYEPRQPEPAEEPSVVDAKEEVEAVEPEEIL